MWWMKFFIAIGVDLFDFSVGRVLFAVPFAGEIIGVAIGYAMFGSKAFTYALECLDPVPRQRP